MEKEISRKEIERSTKLVVSYLEFYGKNGYFPFERKKEIKQ